MFHTVLSARLLFFLLCTAILPYKFVSMPASEAYSIPGEASAKLEENSDLLEPKTDSLSSEEDLRPRNLADASPVQSYKWEDGETTFEIAIMSSKCYGIPRNTIIGDYLFTNGSYGIDVSYHEIQVDLFNLRHQANDPLGDTANHALKNIDSALDNMLRHFESIDSRDELRHLLTLPTMLVADMKNLVLSLTPSAGVGALVGWAIARGMNHMNTSDPATADLNNEIQTLLVVAATTIIVSLSQSLYKFTDYLMAHGIAPLKMPFPLIMSIFV